MESQAKNRIHLIAGHLGNEAKIFNNQTSGPVIPYPMHFAFANWFVSQKEETEYMITNVEGEIPSELEGTYYRIGPGLFELGNVRQHTQDADGMMVMISIKNGKAFYKNRHVRTEAFLKERQNGTEKQLFRGGYGTRIEERTIIQTFVKNIFNSELKNPANKNYLYWGGKLLVLYEMGLPYLINPKTLETLGEWDINGILKKGNDCFSPQPRIDVTTQRLINFGLHDPTQTLTIWEFDNQWNLKQKHQFKLLQPSTLHTFAITKNFIIFATSPIKINAFQKKIHATVDNYVLPDPSRKTLYYVINRNGVDQGKVNSQYKIFEGEPLYHHQTLNAWENENGDIELYSTPYIKKPSFDIIHSSFHNSPSQLTKFIIPTGNSNQTIGKRIESDVIRKESMESPSMRKGLDGIPNRYGYFVDTTFVPNKKEMDIILPWSAIIKVDLKTKEQCIYKPNPHLYMSEVCFVPRKNSESEDDGWTLNLEYNEKTNKSSLLIMDGKSFTPICRLHLNHHIPFTFHGTWIDDIIGFE